MSDQPKILNIILAHHRMDNLIKLCNDLSNHPHFYTIVHVDKKFKGQLPQLPKNCKYTLKRISCHHDSFSLVKVVFESYKSALKKYNYHFDYINLLSGEDLMLREATIFYDFIINTDISFLNHLNIPNTQSSYNPKTTNHSFKDLLKSLEWTPKWFYDQLDPRHFTHDWIEKGTYNYKYFHFPKIRDRLRSSRLQKFATYNKIIRRKLPKPVPKINFYAGSEWFILKHKHFDFCYQNYRKNNYLNFVFKTSLFAGEYYFQTILLNHFNSSEFINSDLRYVNWDKAINGRPQELSKSEIDKALNSNAFFARKAPQWESQ